MNIKQKGNDKTTVDNWKEDTVIKLYQCAVNYSFVQILLFSSTLC